jgi:hypothetical protein
MYAYLRLTRTRLGLIVAALALITAGAALAVPISAPVTNGQCLAPSPSYCLLRPAFSGTFSIQHFALSGSQIVAQGVVVNGSFYVFPYSFSSGTTFPSAAPLTLPVVSISASCSSPTATLTLKGSEPPPSTLNPYEPLPAVFFFDVSYQFPNNPPATATVGVGLLPTTATVQGNRVLQCALARLSAIPQAKAGVVAVLNALLIVPKTD